MNSAIHNELQKLVDEAVRFVWTTPTRKRLMREELLAHVQAVFQEELGWSNDERAALDAARARFGETREIQRELQTSVPLLGRWLLFFKENHMARYFWFAAIAAVAIGMALIMPALAKVKKLAIPDGAEMMLFFAVGLLITAGGVGALGYGAYRRLIRTP